MPSEFVKRQQGKLKLKYEGYLYCLLGGKEWIKNVEMQQKTVQSHCNSASRQENTCMKQI